jgi:hypothetical protein
VFAADESIAGLVERLRTDGWWGEIVGPHGSGKSTLLAALMPQLKAAGRNVLHVALHNGQRRLPAHVWRERFTPLTQVVIDGYEQLSRWQRMRIRRRCKLSRCGLLATAHASVGLPPLYRTSPTYEIAVRVVQSLLAGDEAAMGNEEVRHFFEAQRGDMREMLFALYDVYERRRKSP